MNPATNSRPAMVQARVGETDMGGMGERSSRLYRDGAAGTHRGAGLLARDDAFWRHQPGASPAQRRRSALQQAAHEGQVLAHVGFHRGARVRIGFQVRVSREADGPDGLHDLRHRHAAFAQIARVVLEVELADAILAQPADFLHHVEAGLRAIAHVVIHQHVLRPRAFHDADVVLRGNRVLQPEHDAGFLRLRSYLAEDVADGDSLGLAADRAVAEERQEKYLRAQRAREPDRVQDPLYGQLVVLQAVVVQPVHAGGVDRDPVLTGQAQVASDDLRIVDGHLVAGDTPAKRDLYALETELRGQRQRLRVGPEPQVPIGDADRKRRGGAGQARAKSGERRGT